MAFGGRIGLAVDTINGGMYKLTPEQLSTELAEEAKAVAVDDSDQLYLAVVLKPHPRWEKIGVLNPLAGHP
ncbi:hypothetical protein [Nitrosococcus watsonii]|uniref:hypothetical protein n=1 Tax=Nitrosococcus watsonii TaxID=473531 RepID=UPI0002F5E13E|nr:hypothetical protein [Nitrosococcus watsonii]